MARETTILIVDRSQETREVLRTALAPRGFRILEATQLHEGLALARLHRPRVTVVDLDGAADAAQAAWEFAAAVKDAEGKLIVLGGLPQRNGVCGHELVAKPYHYKPLVLRIEEYLLPQQRGRAAA